MFYINGIYFKRPYVDYINEEETVRIISISDVDNIVNNKPCDITKYVTVQELSKKYKCDNGYMKKGDIVFSLAPRALSKNIFYVRNEPEEKIIYDDTIAVFRTTDDIITSDYIYMLLTSDNISNYIINICKGHKLTKPRLSGNDILNLIIPILDEKDRKQLTLEYYKLLDTQVKFDRLCDGIYSY